MARLIELDPLYCDTIIRRFERVTGEAAVLGDGGASFAQVSAERLGDGGIGADVDPSAPDTFTAVKGAA